MTHALKFATFNCISLVARRRKQWILNTLLKDRVDVAFLQETKLSTDLQVEEMTRFVERHFAAYHSKANGMSGGTAILIRKRTEMKVCPEWETDRNGRVCAVEVLHQGELHKLISVYASNEVAEREIFFKSLRQYVDTPCKTVLAGDFNCVLTQKDCSKRLVSDVSRVELRKLMRDFDLVDMKNHSEMEGPTYTHSQGSFHARFDRVYLSGEFTVSKITSQVQPLAFSDHALVTVTVGRPAPRSKKSSWWSGWKLNESLLEDDTLCVQIKDLIESKTQGVKMSAVLWEDLKADIKLAAYRYSLEKAAREKADKRLLTKTLKILIMEESLSPGVFTQDIRECKGRILELLEKEYRGAMVRSRALFLERDEEPSKIFKTKERQHASRNRISTLRVGETDVSGQEEIEGVFLQAYTKLFTRAEDNEIGRNTGGALPRYLKWFKCK